jgi:hypothetical protein
MVEYKTLRVPEHAWEQAKAQKENTGRTWGEQVVRPEGDDESESVDVSALADELEYVLDNGQIPGTDSEGESDNVYDLRTKPSDFDFDYGEWYDHEMNVRTHYGRLTLRFKAFLLALFMGKWRVFRSTRFILNKIQKSTPPIYTHED